VGLPPPSDSSVALVTGASAGIGEAIARELAARGHGLALAARREERLVALAEELRSEHGVAADAHRADLGDPAGRDALVAVLEEEGREVAILVNNAGIGDYEDMVDADRQALLRMVRLNCEALLDLTSRYLPGMAARGSGAVINIASTAAFQPLPGNATYAATKAFVLSLSEAIHAELGGSGVAVTAVCPGPVKTEFAAVAGVAEAERTTPDLVWTPVEDVAKAAVDGAEKGKRVVVPGLLNRAGALGGQHVPRALALPVARRIWRAARPRPGS
jgi:short-subunit dehydrogenase